jgi:transcriptional regulator NrdR family protein
MNYTFKQVADNATKERINNIQKQIDSEIDRKRKLKLLEQKVMSDLFSFNNGGYIKYKNPW